MAERAPADGAGVARETRRGWWLVDELRPFDAHIHLPWLNRHRPYIAVHVSQWGYECFRQRSRRVLRVQFMWGRLFSDCGGYRVWETRGRWSPAPRSGANQKDGDVR